MKMSKNMLVTSSLALLFSVNLFAQEAYTIQNKTLKEALEIISKKSHLSYIANDKLLELQKTNNVVNVEGLEKTLKVLLKGSGLKALVKNNAIVIIKEELINKKNKLQDVEIQGEWLGESSVDSVKTYTGSRTVIKMEDLEKVAALNIEDALRTIPGVQIQDETGTGVLPNISLRGFIGFGICQCQADVLQ